MTFTKNKMSVPILYNNLNKIFSLIYIKSNKIKFKLGVTRTQPLIQEFSIALLSNEGALLLNVASLFPKRIDLFRDFT